MERIKNLIKLFINIYLGLFVLAGAFVAAYFVLTNQGAEEKILNKPLIAVAFVTVVTLAIFLLKGEKRVNAGILHGSIVFTLFAANLIFEIPVSQGRNSLEIAAERAGVHWDHRSRYEVTRDMSQDGIETYPAAIFPAFVSMRGFFANHFDIDFESLFPLSGISRTRTVLCNETGEWITYTSDRYGFNNDDAVYDSPDRSVLIVGDSFAQGECVPPNDNIAGNLRRRGYRTISLGTAGSGPLIELATLKEYGPHFNPKAVLWLYYEGNDYTDLPGELSFPPLSKYLAEDYSQNLINRQPEIDAFWMDFFDKAEEYLKKEKQGLVFWNKNRKFDLRGFIGRVATLYHIRKRLGLSRGSYLYHPVEQSAVDRNETMFRDVMRAAKQMAEEMDSQLYFVYLPSLNSILDPKQQLLPGSQKARQIVSELGIPMIDFHKRLEESADPRDYFPFRTGGHYTVKGYDLLAELIEDKALNHKAVAIANQDKDF